MSDIWMLRIGIVIAGLLLMAAIYFFGRPRRPEQGRKRRDDSVDRAEPRIPATGVPSPGRDDVVFAQDEMPLEPAVPPPSGPEVGKRDREEFDKIVTLYVAARAGQVLRGPDIVVAAEKAGLSYGYMSIFHRLVDGRADGGPIFSVANIKKPGGFEMADIQSVETPAIAFFLTLPAPIPALDAWEKMLPTAQRMAELLDGVVLDESRNALGRQRIAHIRDDLRAYDRQHEAPPISKNTRW
ncbi:cell division protein ZipA [Lysobacter hankyongensis]|uniref:Cell division protein ZipA n=1 Tax=Lysobacter hankyongensis TaxID=1176535 RepID=A0ABP9BR51_9GAMM